MNFDDKRAAELPPVGASALLEVLIRAGLIFALAALCFQIFAPFLTLMVWGLILAVTLYPMQEYVAAKMGGRQGLAATLIVILGIALIVAPTAILMSSLGDSVQRLIHDVQTDALVIPAGLAFARSIAKQPELNLYVPDKRHPSLAGTYLATCVVFAALTGRSPVGNPYTAGIDPPTAKFLQTVAWETVQEYYQK